MSETVADPQGAFTAAGVPRKGVRVANLLTLSRIALSPFFVWAFLAGHTGEHSIRAQWIALAIAVSFELTDAFDGWVARRRNEVSDFGKILDPLADSVSRFTVFLAFLVEGWASVWAIAPLFWRDSIVSTVRVLAASQGVIVSARFSGKLKAVVQGGAIVGILAAACFRETLGWELDDVKILSGRLMTFVAAVTVYSLFDYLVGNRKVLASLDA